MAIDRSESARAHREKIAENRGGDYRTTGRWDYETTRQREAEDRGRITALQRGALTGRTEAGKKD